MKNWITDAEAQTVETWVVANGNEIHDKPTHFDSDGARIGDTPNRIAAIEYPYGDPAGQARLAQLFAASPKMHDALRVIVREFDCGRTPLARDISAAREALALADMETPS